MIKRIKLPEWILLFLLILLLGIGINKLITYPNKLVNKKDNIQAEKVEEDESNSKYPDIHLKTFSKETDTYTYSISNPETKSEKINSSINRWMKRQKESFLKTVNINEKTLRPAHLNIQLETNRITKDFYSLVFRTYANQGDVNEQEMVKVFNFDVKKEQFLTINDVLDLDKKNLDKIKEIIWEELQENKELQPYLNKKQTYETLQEPDDWQWSIDRKGLTLYWAEYEITEGFAGTVEVSIPIKKLYVFLQDHMDSYLQMSKEQQVEKKKITQKELKKSFTHGKYIALTFDDGPSPQGTPQILKTLKEYDAKATFFMLGNQVDYYPDLARKVIEDGHEIGNHTRSHPNLSKMSEAYIKKELEYTNEKIEEVTGVTPRLIRPPYGIYNDNVVECAKENNQSIILWSVDTLDWKNRNGSAIQKIVQNESTPGAIVLLHDIHSTTADALPKLLKTLKQAGYQFITVSQLLDWKEKEGVSLYYGSRK
ncbi:polysaccharide deacetylase family protein [Virgibacillus proomii]|uniref:polysaccharide deacetylase family protein n=1 Tax=Virgibacillus proomii TaxID=84407 RepID=UPI001C122356|nr:polysaccharide deacetylase family protein [Virgibacillus proomii]MBU5267686.1 polysaccharide deacetylase family protein [Virgibacillus proomii]